MTFMTVLLIGFGLLTAGFVGYGLANRHARMVEYERMKARGENTNAREVLQALLDGKTVEGRSLGCIYFHIRLNGDDIKYKLAGSRVWEIVDMIPSIDLKCASVKEDDE